MRKLLLFALTVGAASCSVTLKTDGRTCTRDAQCDATQVCRHGVCEAAGPGEICLPSVSNRCVDNAVHSFDSCGADEGVVEACVANAACELVGIADATCVCTAMWQGTLCDVCPAGYDASGGCATCVTGYDLASDCTQCLGNRDPASDCATCLTGFANPDNDDCGRCVRYVDAAAPAGGDGLSWASAINTLQAGIAVAYQATAAATGNADDPARCDVWVRAGTYAPTEGADRQRTVTLRSGVDVYGGFSATALTFAQRDPATAITTLDGNTTGTRVFHVLSGANNAVLDGFTVRGGGADGDLTATATLGGGMLNDGVSPTLRNVVFTDNYAAQAPDTSPGYGGGMANIGGASPTLEGCAFIGNHAQYAGGAIYNDAGSTAVTLIATDFDGNTLTGGMGGGGTGGAIHFVGDAGGSIRGGVFSANATANGGRGGAIQLNTGSLSVSGATLSSNIGGYGGAIVVQGGTLQMSDCTLADNTANGDADGLFGGGGALHIEGGETTLERCVVTGNSVNVLRTTGGGINVTSGTLTLTNVVLRDNSCTGPVVSQGGGLFAASNVTLSVFNTTVYNNSVDGSVGQGGGLYIPLTVAPVIVNSIVWGNQLQGIYGNTDGVEYSDTQDGPLRPADTNIEVDPLFVGGAPYSLHLQASSPCIDAGSANFTGVPSDDIEGTGRPQGSAWDMGAYEYTP